jgi:hypothetical protein
MKSAAGAPQINIKSQSFGACFYSGQLFCLCPCELIAPFFLIPTGQIVGSKPKTKFGSA